MLQSDLSVIKVFSSGKGGFCDDCTNYINIFFVRDQYVFYTF
jgi:hypothetical protein